MLSPTKAFVVSDVRSAIVRHPLTVTPETSVMDAIAKMSRLRAVCTTPAEPDSLAEIHREVRSSCVLVMAEDKLLGIVTERDIVRFSAQRHSIEALTVRHVMTQAVITLQESALTDLFIGVNLLRQHQIRHLPILDEQEHLVGLVSHESLRYITQSLEILRLRLVSEVMTSDVVCAVPSCSVLEIAQLMSQHRVSSVILVQPVQVHTSSDTHTPLEMPIGILTERDIVQFQSLGLDAESCLAEAVMSTPVFAISPDASLWTTQAYLQQQRIHRLVVTGSQGELLGIVTQTSLLNALNPVELYQLAEVLDQKVKQLEAANLQQLERRNDELERQVEERTRTLQAKVEQAALVAAIATQIRSSLSLQAILETTVEQVRQVLSCDRVNIWRLNADGSTVAVAESTDSSRSLVGESIDDECFQHDQAEAYRQGKIWVVRDVDAIELSDCHRDFLKRIQTRSKILVPLLCGEELWGLLNACEADEARDWQPEEVELMQALAVQLAIALQQATTHEQLQAELKVRQQTEVRLRESEQRYASLVAASPVGILHTDLEGICIYANERHCEILGIDPAAIVGQPWFQGYDPEVRELIIHEYGQSLKHGRPLRVEYPARRCDGSEVWVFGQVAMQYGAEGHPIGYVGTITDISDRKQAESLLEEQFQILERIAKAEPLMDVFQALLKAMETYLQETVCTIMLCQNGQLCHACAPSLPQAYLDVVETSGFPIAEGVGSCGTAAYRGEIVIAADIATDPLWQDYKQLAFDNGLKASWSVPVFDQTQTVLAVFGIYYREARSPHSHEIEFVKKLANLAGVAIERSQASQALGQLNQELENRVKARTAELEASKRRYASLAKAAPVAIFRFDKPLHCVYVNERWCKMTGRSAEFAMGYGWLEAVHPDDRVLNIDEWNRDYTQARPETHIIQGTETRHVHPDGRIIWCHVNIAQELDDNGNVVGYVGTLTDITARKTAELALQESQTQLRHLTENIPGMIYRYVLHPDGRDEFTHIGPQVQQLYELNPDDVLQDVQLMWDRIHPDDVQHVSEELQAGAESLQPTCLEFRLCLPEARVVWAQAIFRAEHHENGDIVWDGVVIDISDRKQVELALEREVLRRSAVFDASSDGIHILDRAGNLIEANAGFAQMLGYSMDEISQMHVTDWDEQWSCAEIKEILDSYPSDRPFYASIETFHRRKDGFVFPVEISKCSMEWNGEFTLVCISRDISERKQAEARLQHTNEELARATRLKDEFLANMSHELRTPLNVVLGMTEGLKEQVFGQLNERQIRSLDAIENSGNHLLEMITDILDLSKIEAGQIELNFSPTNIATLCQSSLLFVKHQAKRKQIQLNLELPEQLPGPCMMDERRIRQVLINLLSNAVKFTPKGGSITLFAHCQMREASLQFSVTDTGIGIAREQMPKLFQPFMQIDSALSRQYSGTGLGLALVKRLVELHGGNVWLTSEVDVGSCFIIELPFQPYVSPTQNSQSSTATEDKMSTVKQETSKPLILLAEDNESNLDMLSSYLEFKGFQLCFARNGYEAIAQAKSEFPQLIVMDIQMPDLDGLEAIRQIRCETNLTHIPIIALAALAMNGDRERCLEAGANDYLTKPVKLQQLTELIQRFLEQSEQESENN